MLDWAVTEALSGSGMFSGFFAVFWASYMRSSWIQTRLEKKTRRRGSALLYCGSPSQWIQIFPYAKLGY
jgi:hypothetical protein